MKYGTMTDKVVMHGAPSLYLEKGMRVTLEEPTNLPGAREAGKWFARPCNGIWPDGQERDEEYAILIDPEDVDTQMKYGNPGSVSWGTHREEDLIPKFEALLDELDGEYDRPSSVDRLLAGEPLSDNDHCVNSIYLNEELFTELNKHAPPGYYFGSHPGDGADFGFWKDGDGTTDPDDLEYGE